MNKKKLVGIILIIATVMSIALVFPIVTQARDIGYTGAMTINSAYTFTGTARKKYNLSNLSANATPGGSQPGYVRDGNNVAVSGTDGGNTSGEWAYNGFHINAQKTTDRSTLCESWGGIVDNRRAENGLKNGIDVIGSYYYFRLENWSGSTRKGCMSWSPDSQ